jgi:hypothetical protein
MKRTSTEFCAVAASKFVDSFDFTAVTTCVAAVTCTDSCKTLVNGIVSGMGCCLFPTVSNKFPTFVSVFVGLFAKCSIGVPAVCSGAKKVEGSMKLKNLKYSYVAANMAKVKMDITADIAANIGVSPSKILVTLSQDGTTTTTVVAYTITSTNDAEGPAVKADLDAQITANTFTFPTVNSYPSTAKNSADEGVTADSTSYTSTTVDTSTSTTSSTGSGGTTTTSPASAVLPSFVLLLALFAAKSLF